MHQPAAGHVPPAHRVPAEQDRRARVAPRRRREQRLTDTPEIERRLYLGSWRVDVTVRPGVVVPIATAALARAIAAALDAAAAPAPAGISLILADDRELEALNRTHMGEDGPTDVLSFPLSSPAAFPPHAGQDPTLRRRGASADFAEFGRPPGRRHLGDVVVSVERARAHAAEGRGGHTGDVRWSVGAELRLLVVHGTLHVCGWDHRLPAEEEAMRALETRILEQTT